MLSPVVSTVQAVIQYCSWGTCQSINANKRINEIQIGDHEIKKVNFTGNTTIFVRGVTCPNRTQMILSLYEKDKLVQR